MTDISAHTDQITAAIYEQYKKRGDAELSRGYLGGSAIGGECWRALWYGFRWASPTNFDGRMYRLFQTGHLAEPRFVGDLRSIGAKVWEADPATGKQFSYSDVHGHMRGNLDAVAVNIPGGGKQPHLVEMKTHSAKSFKDLKAKGVKLAKPQHYAQMMVYCGWAKLTRALYLAVNKDTDELYSERLEFNATDFAKLVAKAESIIFAAEPPARLSEDPNYFICNWCDHKAVCHGHKVPQLSCRTCVHATPERDGDARWSCAKWAQDIPLDAQRAGCDHHLPLPFLLTYATTMDAGEGWIEFARKDNGAFFVVVVPGASHPYPHFPIYSSKEIAAATDHKAICDPKVEEIRTTLGATLVG